MGMRRTISLITFLVMFLGGFGSSAGAHDLGGWNSFTDGYFAHHCTYSNSAIAHHDGYASFVGITGSAVNREHNCDSPQGEYAGHINTLIQVYRWDGDHWTTLYQSGWIYNWDGQYQSVYSWVPDYYSLVPAWYMTRTWSYVWDCTGHFDMSSCNQSGHWEGGYTDSPYHFLPG
jgi:hypothetical protein